MGLLSQMMTNIANPAKQEKRIPLPKLSASAKEALQSPQTPVSQGQLLLGEVMDLRANQIVVLLQNGATITARTDGTLDLSIGQNARFLVSGTTEEQVILKHVKEETASGNPMAEKALAAAGITKTDRSIAIVTELLSHQQPVNDTVIRHYLSLANKYPELPVKDIILMELHQIPVTPEHVQQFASYLKGEHSLLTQAKTMLQEFTGSAGFLPEAAQPVTSASVSENVSVSPAVPVPEDVSVPDGESTPVPAPEVPSTSVSEGTLSDMQPTAEYNTTAPHSLPSAFVSPKTAESETILSETSVLELSKTDVLDEFTSLQKNLLLAPEDIAKSDKVKDYYRELEEKLSHLEQLSSKSSETAKEAVPAAPKQMRSNLSFMKAVNEVFPFLQLPLRLKDTPTHGELYVYERKKALHPGESVSALLHLELEALGATDIYITLKGSHVNTRFSLQKRDACDLIKKELPKLEHSLSVKGYSLQSEVTLSKDKKEDNAPSLLEQFLEEHAPGGLTRYSFDIRA